MPRVWTGGTVTGAFISAARGARPRLAGIGARVAIGPSDPFYAATRTFVAGINPPAETDFGTGGHTVVFWRYSAAGQLRFLGHTLAGV